MEDVAIIGVGMHPFGRFDDRTGLEMGLHAVNRALDDAGVKWKDIECAFGGSIDAGFADSLVSRLGPSGIQFTNVVNGCATAGSALSAAVTAIRAGQCDLALAVGFDKHPAGMFSVQPEDWGLGGWFGETGMMVSTQFFAMKIRRYMHDWGITDDSLVRVAVKNFKNGSMSENAWRRTPFDFETVASSDMLNDPLRKYMFCAPCEGGAAAVVCRGELAARYTRKPIWVKGLAVRTRKFGSLEVFQPANPIVEAETPTEIASKAAFEQAAIDPRDVQVAQLQDTESGAEIMHMAETGLCAHGEQEAMIANGETEIDGPLPINTDGGLLANGEPVGASGLRQVYEVCLQLRGEAGERQSPRNPKVGFCQVYGAPGLSAVVILAR